MKKLSRVLEIMDMAITYDYKTAKIARDKCGTLTVSTANTPDMGYETAIGDKEGRFHPVQRYTTREEAIAGHAEWLTKLPNLKEVIKLGDEDLEVEPKLITIER